MIFVAIETAVFLGVWVLTSSLIGVCRWVSFLFVRFSSWSLMRWSLLVWCEFIVFM